MCQLILVMIVGIASYIEQYREITLVCPRMLYKYVRIDHEGGNQL